MQIKRSRYSRTRGRRMVTFSEAVGHRPAMVVGARRSASVARETSEMANFGIYRGVVMNAGDPMMKARLQVSIPSVLGAGTNWASPCREFGSKKTPPIGTAVWVMFEEGDPSRPVWMGCAA